MTRVELGCGVPGQINACFCTGRCKRTAEEQEAYERREKGWSKIVGIQAVILPIDPVADSLVDGLLKRARTRFLPIEPPIPTEDDNT